MNCLICRNNTFMNAMTFNSPDKYESWMGISDIERTWWKCDNCGFYIQSRNYDLSRLEAIYKEGYRHPDFRGKSIREEFDNVMNLPDSENKQRVDWILENIKHPKSLLDIGSGFGVFPYEFRKHNAEVWCVEENLISIDFIQNELDMNCMTKIPEGVVFELVSLIHILEHIEDPDEFLQKVKKTMRSDGYLYIEVPASEEFEYLPKDHDEFNSCHLYSYNVSHLWNLVDRNGFVPTNIRQIYYKDRNLTRIMMLCRKRRES